MHSTVSFYTFARTFLYLGAATVVALGSFQYGFNSAARAAAAKMNLNRNAVPIKQEATETVPTFTQNDAFRLDVESKDLLEKLLKTKANDKNKLRQIGTNAIQSIMLRKIEEVTHACKTDEETCIGIAEWIVKNISNAGPTPRGPVANLTFATRRGFSSSRAQLFVEMLGYKNIEAAVFNLYNFGGVGGGHNCVQAHYDGKWHFFDVTDAGYFRNEKGIMSWNEIVSNPHDAAARLIVIPGTRDKWGSHLSPAKHRRGVRNEDRMVSAYSPERIAVTSPFGFYKRDDIKTLEFSADLSSVNTRLVIGNLDNSPQDVEQQGRKLKLTEQLSWCLGTVVDTFHLRINFPNADPNQVYVVTFDISQQTKEGLEFWAKPENGEVVNGAKFSSNGETRAWTTTLIPSTSEEVSLLFGYDFRGAGKGLALDRISIQSTSR